MIDQEDVPSVKPDELLARFIVQRSHIRRRDQTLKQDAFIPHPHLDLSVTRHWQATDEELWSVGGAVATSRVKTLYGRGDIQATVCAKEKLIVEAAPISGNPNHANISDWPEDKPAQKIIAAEIAANATFVSKDE